MKWSQHVTLDMFLYPSTKMSRKFTCNATICYIKTIQSNCLCKEQPNKNSLIVATKFNPISSGSCVHFGTKLKVLIVFFVENKQQDDSALISVFLLNIYSRTRRLDIE